MIYLFMLQVASAAPFTDTDLDRDLKKSCNGTNRCIIYVWSPSMNLSVKGLNELNRYSKNHRLNSIVLLDPNADRKLAERVRKQNNWLPETTRTLASEKLIGRGARVHYPNYSFAQKGQLRGNLVPGLRRPKDLDLLQRRYFH